MLHDGEATNTQSLARPKPRNRSKKAEAGAVAREAADMARVLSDRGEVESPFMTPRKVS
jgi:hypothetical protein